MSFGFIIPIHINYPSILTHVTNNIISILKNYPKYRIILIDDGSTLTDCIPRLFSGILSHGYLITDISVETVPKNYTGKGEINPFYYFYHNKYFDTAIILNDGCTSIKPIDFPVEDINLVYMWYFNYHYGWEFSQCPPRENPDIKTHEDVILNLLEKFQDVHTRNRLIETYRLKHTYLCCYASICMISHTYLVEIEDKTGFLELRDYIQDRIDRMALETLIGVFHSYVSGPFGIECAVQGFMGNQVEDNNGETKPRQDDTHPRGPYQKVNGKYFTKTSWGR